MSSRWFRMYDEVLDDPKVQRLDPILFKTWINVLCAASRRNGVMPSLDELAFMLRCDETFLGEQIDALYSAGLLDESDDGVTPHNWNGRQFQSDTSTDRVKRFRNKRRNVSETTTETPPDTESDTDKEISLPSEARPPDDENKAIDAYNEIAPEAGWPVVQRKTAQRISAVRVRLSECGGLDGFRETLKRARGSPFLCGDNDRGWKADFDFLVKSKNFTKLMEGGYDRTTAGGNGKARPHDVDFRALARVAEKRDVQDRQRMDAAGGQGAHGASEDGSTQPGECPPIPPELRRIA